MFEFVKEYVEEYHRLESYVPIFYQIHICKINYEYLNAKGVKLLSFDINGTLAEKDITKPSKKLIDLFVKLRTEGFKCVLISSKDNDRVRKFAQKLDVPYISADDKSRRTHFQKALEMYASVGIKKNQMAHIGNELEKDIFNGNQFGIITCLVKRAYVREKQKDSLLSWLSSGNKQNEKKSKLEKKLEDSALWCRHHRYTKDDQYYQLGVEPPYKIVMLERAYCRE